MGRISLTSWTHQKSSSLGTTTRTWTSSLTETKALHPNSQAPSPRFTTPTSCTPSTTPSTPSCTRPRPRNKDNKVNPPKLFFAFFCYLILFSVQCDIPQNVLFLS